MKYCKICINTDTRPKTKFESHGICGVCTSFRSFKNNYSALEKFKTLKTL